MISLEVNGKKYEVEVSSDAPLLWVIRERLGLTGTKYGCGKSFCGAKGRQELTAGGIIVN